MKLTTSAIILGFFAAAKAELPDIAAITSVDPSSFPSYQTGGLIRQGSNVSNLVTRQDCPNGQSGDGNCCATAPILTWGDAYSGGPGISIANGSPDTYYGFYIYENSCDSIPYKYIWIAGGATEYITLPSNFAGRITRGTDAMNLAGVPNLLGTWFEFNWQPDGWIWGDISLIRGCDQGVLLWTTDGSGAWKGFTQDILANAPVGAWAEKPDGTWVLAPTEGPTADAITLDYELSAVGAEYAYLDDSHGSPVIAGTNGFFATYWDPGTM
ncbi:hypothetical protein V8E51_010622 [Hyaloscypha variabilis]